MPMLDIFKGDAFNVVNLTKSINDAPYQPKRLAELKLFAEDGITTTALTIEKRGTALSLVPNAPRGGVPVVKTGDKAQMVSISTSHLPQMAAIRADEVQNVRAFGSESDVETVQNLVNKRLAKLRRDIDVTIEYQRMGAIKGQVLDADGSTVLLDLFSTFGGAATTHSMALATGATDVRVKCLELKRKIEAQLGGLSYSGIRVFCSPGFFDDLVGHADVKESYRLFQNSEMLRNDPRAGFLYGGILWEEYRGSVGGQDFITDGEAYAVPEGVSDLFLTNFAPADYMETVNTIGLPYYAKQEVMPMDKGINIEGQSNPISICTRPTAIGKLAA